MRITHKEQTTSFRVNQPPVSRPKDEPIIPNIEREIRRILAEENLDHHFVEKGDESLCVRCSQSETEIIADADSAVCQPRQREVLHNFAKFIISAS